MELAQLAVRLGLTTNLSSSAVNVVILMRDAKLEITVKPVLIHTKRHARHAIDAPLVNTP